MDPKAVSNSTSLIYLAKVNKLELMRELFRQVYIPDSVYHEVVTRGKELKIPDAAIIEKTVNDCVIREKVREKIYNEYAFLTTNLRLGLGEKEALLLCKQLEADFLLADDKEARRIAKMLNIKPVGTCGIIIAAYKRGIIDRKTAVDIINELVKAGLRISTQLYQRILHELGIKL
jgi:predicted nucleic acid-binding protein